MNEYEARRQANIKRNQVLVQELGLDRHNIPTTTPPTAPRSSGTKRRKLKHPAPPTRSSARIAAGARHDYEEPPERQTAAARSSNNASRRRQARPTATTATATSPLPPPSPRPDVAAIQSGWTSWTAVAPAPTRDAAGTFHFASHAGFTPNKSPEEMLREGCFGGSYFRPLRSKALGIVVREDWRELPGAWTAGLDAGRYLVSEEYDPAVNKFGVACGQSIEEWEAAGWIAHEWDVRGWFQWYCRFWMGRRGGDDERQVGRWARCVGERGRWRRTLLKRYVAMGVRSVFDDGDGEGEVGEVSPVVHQTCHHWAYEVRQEALDRFWAEGL